MPPMRQPTPRSELYAWHAATMLLPADPRTGLRAADVTDMFPKCGWFSVRLHHRGPFVPARIFVPQAICPLTGELLEQELFVCEIGDDVVSAFQWWPTLCKRAVTYDVYRYLRDLLGYAKAHAPNEPLANPRRAVDWVTMPVPVFTKPKRRRQK